MVFFSDVAPNEKMAKQKKDPSMEAAISLVFLFAILWVVDRSLAWAILKPAIWIALIAVVVVGVYISAKRGRSGKAPGVRTFASDSQPGVSGSHGGLSRALERDSTNRRRPVDSHDIPEPVATPDEWSLDLIKTLEWKRFEMLCAGYFEAKGYHPETTRIGADGGIDIILHRKSDPAGKIFGVVQCKAWGRVPVGIKPVRELFGVKAAEDAPLAVFITTSDYTKDAKAFAEGKHLQLITGTKLVELLRELPEPTSSELLHMVTMGDYKTPTCSHCDIKMVLQTSKKGNNPGHQFWGCRNFPRCRQTLNMPSKA